MDPQVYSQTVCRELYGVFELLADPSARFGCISLTIGMLEIVGMIVGLLVAVHYTRAWIFGLPAERSAATPDQQDAAAIR